jgi:uncharacterized protein (TIGR02284 family)
MEATHAAIDHLNLLLVRSYDAEKGYKKASEDVENVLLKNFLDKHSQQRYEFGHQLKAEVRNLGGEPQDGTSLLGDIHRAWIDFRSALATKDELAVLDECERGEDTAIKNYEEVLADTTLPESTRTLLMKQRDLIAEAVQKIKTLKLTFKKD